MLKLERKTEAISSDEVQVWGQDVVLVSRPDVLVNIKELADSEQWVSVTEKIKGRDVISADGTRIGQLNDVVIDLNGRLVDYHLARVFVEGPPVQSKRIAVEATRSLGQDVLIVDMAEVIKTDTAPDTAEEEIAESQPEEGTAITTVEDTSEMNEGESDTTDEGTPQIL